MGRRDRQEEKDEDSLNIVRVTWKLEKLFADSSVGGASYLLCSLVWGCMLLLRPGCLLFIKDPNRWAVNSCGDSIPGGGGVVVQSLLWVGLVVAVASSQAGIKLMRHVNVLRSLLLLLGLLLWSMNKSSNNLFSCFQYL